MRVAINVFLSAAAVFGASIFIVGTFDLMSLNPADRFLITGMAFIAGFISWAVSGIKK